MIRWGQKGHKMTLLTIVERHLRSRALSPSRFGRQVSGDPRFLFDLRNGREPRSATTARVLAYIAGAEMGNDDSAFNNNLENRA